MSLSAEHSPVCGVVALQIVPTVDQIADAFDLLWTYRWFRGELGQVHTRQAQPFAAARTLLAAVAPEQVLAGVAVWESRQTPNGADYTPAALRARRLWAAGGER